MSPSRRRGGSGRSGRGRSRSRIGRRPWRGGRIDRDGRCSGGRRTRSGSRASRRRSRLSGRSSARSRASGSRRGRRRLRARRSVVVMARFQRHCRRTAKRLQVRDDAEDLLIGQANRGLVDRRHPRIESRHDEGVRLVERLREIIDVAVSRLARLRPVANPVQVREAQRPTGLPNRVAREAEPLAVHDLATDHDHVGGRQVGSNHGLLRR